jgi:hypothetical protein
MDLTAPAADIRLAPLDVSVFHPPVGSPARISPAAFQTTLPYLVGPADLASAAVVQGGQCRVAGPRASTGFSTT